MTSHEARRRARQEMDDVTQRLLADFAHLVPAGTVIRQLARAREDLLAAGVRAGLADAAEAMTRTRLSRIVPAHAAVGVAG